MNAEETSRSAEPEISVIVCAHNREKMLDACLRSILTSDHPSFEVIVVDDASTDGALGVARRHEAEDGRVRVFVRERNVGSFANLNLAHRHARGRYIGWVDSDDLILPDCLSACAAELDVHPEVGCVYTDQMVIDEHNRPIGYGRRAKVPYSKERMLLGFMTFHFRLYRRELHERVGGLDESFAAAADYDFCLKLSEVTEFRRLPRPLYLYRRHADTISSGRRAEQIECSARAIRNAMERRGMSETHRLDADPSGRIRLVKLGATTGRTRVSEGAFSFSPADGPISARK
ncbi:MAG: glycosyltransferase [Phycisphaerales bacterium]|nr:glycosyltransferase [Phycisphaerales bacterium]